ncbi:unnamed protein product [Adineta steineri]|uniref:Uncharacterized protein n=1 Tax=Adineta steineri TaxID=433720 RepID=A0A818JFS4_9BILA|nr:unnamed protein product [Adineta steineri]CAF3540242.1 unnamed protein product [Adineta steineri]
MGWQLSDLTSAVYDSKRREFLGRDGAKWLKLSTFYCFYYIGSVGFFCTMVAILMAITPHDRPRYSGESSSMETRSNPLSPGLGFRPQPTTKNDSSLVFVNNNTNDYQSDPYIQNLDQYLRIYYWNNNHSAEENKFTINNPGSCTPNNQYGFSNGTPCILVKMNKIVDFEPRPGHKLEDKDAYEAAGCQPGPDAIAVHCYGEYPIDVDNIGGNITYISEANRDHKCGSLETKWFPYTGKQQRRNVYQAPYVWVQFNNPKPNVLINVICRVYAENIIFDKKKGQGSTRFQIYVKDLPRHKLSKQNQKI